MDGLYACGPVIKTCIDNGETICLSKISFGLSLTRNSGWRGSRGTQGKVEICANPVIHPQDSTRYILGIE